MNYWTSLRLKAIDFFKRNRRIIMIVLIIWAVVIVIEYYLRSHQVVVIEPPSTTYDPFVTTLDDEKVVPEKYQEPIQNIIEEYFNYCNNGEYEKAYNLISEDCRRKYYPTLEEFTGYINKVFEGKKKIYNIQSYSIVDNKYIFNIRILDDILANGTTDGYYYYEEKFVLIEENGEFKLSIAEYIGEENPEVVAEDDNIKVEVVNKSVGYETETYTLVVTNKTDNYVVISDNTQSDEIELFVNGEARYPNNMQLAFFSVPPGGKNMKEVEFTKYYDEGVDDEEIVFTDVRVLKEYDWAQGTTQENLDSAVKVYGFEIPLQ